MATRGKELPGFSINSLTICGLILVILCHTGQADEEYTESHSRLRRAAAGGQRTKLKAVVILNDPYVMKANQTHFDNYGGYRGFIPDLLYEISRLSKIDFELHESPDGKYGTLVNGNWTGMIGEVIKGGSTGADIAAADLTMTRAREEYVDFIKPFQDSGLTILVKRPDGANTQKEDWHYTFTVLRPLSVEVWLVATAGVLVVALILWGNNRINPYEWGGRHNLGRASETASEHFNFSGAAWFTFSTLQWQGFEKAPRSISSRVLTVFWFVFVTLTLLTYTGSLINSLFWSSTVHGKRLNESPIQSLGDLVRNTDFDYGFIEGGSTQMYFMKRADGPIYNRMRKYWNSDRGRKALMPSLDKAVERVKLGNYAFICEITMAKYLSGKYCELTTVGPLIARRSYGMAVNPTLDAAVVEDLHQAILELTEEGDIQAIEEKWWQEETECWIYSQANEIAKMSSLYVNEPKAINLDMFLGPLLILLAGIIFSFVISIAEILYYKHKGRYQRSNRPGGAQLQLDDDATT